MLKMVMTYLFLTSISFNLRYFAQVKFRRYTVPNKLMLIENVS
jgi:hypothetical protein